MASRRRSFSSWTGKLSSVIVLPERLTSRISFLPLSFWAAIRRTACWVTQRSTAPIRPKRSAVARKAPGGTSWPFSPRIRSSSSYWVTSSVSRFWIGWQTRTNRPRSVAWRTRSVHIRFESSSSRSSAVYSTTRSLPFSLASYMATSASAEEDRRR